MVHPTTFEQPSIWSTRGFSVRLQRSIEYGMEFWYIVGSALYCIGSYAFIPGVESSTRPGCRLFDVGSVMFAIGSFVGLQETLRFRQKLGAKWCSLKILDQSLYHIGSWFYLVGTLIWDPDILPYFVAIGGTYASWRFLADAFFMIGSCIFSCASFVTALYIHHEAAPPLLRTFAVVITTCYEFGGFLFIAGTMGFMPGYDCSSAFLSLGASFYLVGSGFYLIGCCLSLSKAVVTHRIHDNRTGDVIFAGVQSSGIACESDRVTFQSPMSVELLKWEGPPAKTETCLAFDT